MVSPIQRKKISEQIAIELKKLIKEKRFPPGSKLPSENELAKMFGVSRSPVREALSVLEASGLVDSKQGGGNYVTEVNLVNLLDSYMFEVIDVKEVFYLLEMRTIVESEAAALAAIRWKDDDLLAIKKALDEFAITMEDEQSIGHEADFAFHHEVVKASYNPFLLHSVDSLRDLYEKTLNFSLKQNIGMPRKREQVLSEHLAIFKSIESRDSKAAAYNMKRHLINTRIKLGDESISTIEIELI
ncbi:FadR/GntR family transcriptional regulator [Bacillus chungangensis]|uniref:GntR family transcriptional repressor for pyruvate dehydrogenase complex n=1 Tax=Bacillus chungangensis TaxID=587633 RepID=A0ABT9WX49_9BACI|nr:FadR/GntR family transcriptional regulator [Bacillus chungangensis]MDQ0177809.1 GntR family transcriptional repressor for pyruvate dehydrogenase complex [Bacillus chungangensis]